MGLFTEYELRQQKINAYEMPDCMKWENKNMRKVVRENSNWEIYTADMKHFYSIAKPDSGCRSSYFGDVYHIRKLMRDDHIKPSQLTRLGRRLMRV